MRRLSVIPVLFVALAVLAVAVWWWPGGGDPDGSDRRGGGDARPVAVVTAEAERRELVERRRFTGSLEGGDRIEITPRVTGHVREVAVALGDRVEPGDLLLRLDAEEFEQELERAEAELAVAESGLAEARAGEAAARRELARTRDLREQGIASSSELEAAETERELAVTAVALAESRLRQNRSAVRSAAIQLEYTRIHADRNDDGESGATRYVAERQVDRGALVGTGDTLLTLVRLTPMRAVLSVTEGDYARLQRGMPVEVTTPAWPGERFDGEISRIAPEFRPGSRQARVEVELPNDDERLRPGMFAELSVELDRHAERLAIPRDAVMHREAGAVIFVVEDAGEDGDDAPVARRHTVTTGVRDGDFIELREPELEPGTRVVVLGQHLLSDGTPLRIRDDAPGSGQ
ncbi:efflux RND transporter periplasmic adaptor subunit [Thioalkalivibrio sp. ALJ24]|uniref:efflux RND transporter periplasmic adaptor subunit n=1 Tax=Thioalkalivibrio sp. ALJ24 TaxID=545276 RepID=UPI000365E59F|nr:efflux RND transporter periplasmic adaptor subunit [Thioalkalivibrio sp. ALJ24]